MTTSKAKWIQTLVVATVGVVGLVVMVAWLSGWFHAKVAPGGSPVATGTSIEVVAGDVIEVQVRQLPRTVRAVGTVEAVHETEVGSRLLARVKKVHVAPGQHVAVDDVLIELERDEIQARLSQSQANVAAQRARLAQVESDFEKVTKLFEQRAATQRELDDLRRSVDVTRADLTAREQALAEVTSQLSYATVRSPMAGVVIDKHIQEGDLAQPGQALVTLYNPDRLQLVAAVPERLALKLKVDDPIGVEIDALGLACEGTISQIVPQASPASRSMLVKVTGPCPPGVYSGMFGRVLIPEGTRQQLRVPAAAVRRIGQLEMVQVIAADMSDDDQQRVVVERRFVRTGEVEGGQVEVLSGLSPGEKVRARFMDDLS